MKIDKKPDFSLSLLHPKHWGVWIGFGLLALIVNLLPYALLYKLGRGLGKFAMRFGGKRAQIARRNLELAFPEKSPQEIDAFVEENFKNSGMALIETGITWFWPTWRFKRILVEKDISALSNMKPTIKAYCCAACTHSTLRSPLALLLCWGSQGMAPIVHTVIPLTNSSSTAVVLATATN